MSEQLPKGWYAYRDAGCPGIWHVASTEPEQHLASVGTSIMGDDEAEAVAYLMAAAQKLRWACEAALAAARSIAYQKAYEANVLSGRSNSYLPTEDEIRVQLTGWGRSLGTAIAATRGASDDRS